MPSTACERIASKFYCTIVKCLKVLNGEFHNKRTVAKPRTRWEDVVRRGTSEILGIRGWRGTGRRQQKMEASSDGGQGPEGAVAP
jgi:hypothetical protein